MKKNFFLHCFIFIFGIIFILASCTKKNLGLAIIEDTDIKTALFNYNFDYKIFMPGSQMSYNYLWDGYDTNNKFGPNLSNEDKLSTYLTSYGDIDDNYYLIYIKSSIINKNLDWLSSYQKNNISDSNNYHFTLFNEDTIIDGKYLFLYQNTTMTLNNNMKFYSTDDINSIRLNIEDYKLAFCSTRKKIIIKDNLSSNKKLNQEIFAYNRYEIIFDNSEAKHYEFSTFEKNNQNLINNMFNYKGEMIEVFSEQSQFSGALYFPMLGLKNKNFNLPIRASIINNNNKKCVLLPRYIINNETKLDLFDESTDFTYYEDVFGKYKSLFKNAYLEDTNDTNENYLMALYDYEKVSKIILN